jgi:D-alanyl-D-alanine carboxypeptidase
LKGNPFGIRPLPAAARLSPNSIKAAPFLALALLVSACGSHTTGTRHAARPHYSPSRYYAPSGPASDPWGPYIREASGRFGVPEQWVRAVMRQESGGQQDVISWAGAMGLMQVMPETYAELRNRHSLGDDPFDPHNNILAGTAYLREMYDRYGAPGFLAAYNAGPNRVDRYLTGGTPLPEETVSYVAAITPRLGPGTPLSGPLAIYGGAPFGGATTRWAKATPSSCDPDAAYNPDGPCTPAQPKLQLAAAAPVPAVPSYGYQPTVAYAGAGCDADAAYDPAHQCRPAQPAPNAAVPDRSYAPVPAVATPLVRAEPTPAFVPPQRPAEPCDPDAAYEPGRNCRYVAQASLPQPAPQRSMAQTRFPPYTPSRPIQETMGHGVMPASLTAAMPPGHWAIQVGAFPTLSAAESAANRARANLPDLLRMANVELPATAPLGTQVAFRARLTGLPAATASDACARLTRQGTACMVVPPSSGA